MRAPRSPPSTVETLREPPVSPPGTLRPPGSIPHRVSRASMLPPSSERRSVAPHPGPASSSSDSSESAPRRLVPYQLDTPPPLLVSLRRRRISTMRCASHLVPRARARPRRPRLDLSPRRCRQGVVPADPTAAEAVSASRQPRAMDDATQPKLTSKIRTQRVTSAQQAPKDLLREGRCGSTTELLGAVVDVRGHGHISTAATYPACSPLRAGDPMPFAPSPDEPCEPARFGSPQHPAATTEATTNQHSTHRRPDNRSPTVHLA